MWSDHILQRREYVRSENTQNVVFSTWLDIPQKIENIDNIKVTNHALRKRFWHNISNFSYIYIDIEQQGNNLNQIASKIFFSIPRCLVSYWPKERGQSVPWRQTKFDWHLFRKSFVWQQGNKHSLKILWTNITQRALFHLRPARRCLSIGYCTFINVDR